ncbi:hypothetical protein C0Q70_21093 [Pomacea canaliculata]|uniref:Uncharacterized protein n=1 Tax=Pomacea canaliculata TaxID=400727 RepID=A0A2T7NBJ6_POMCA|nr:hypothetical protein C0Q70_21093 [Pomacea canaliculata]
MTDKVWPYPCLYTSRLEIACLSAAEEHVLFKFTSGFRNCRKCRVALPVSEEFVREVTPVRRHSQGRIPNIPSTVTSLYEFLDNRLSNRLHW